MSIDAISHESPDERPYRREIIVSNPLRIMVISLAEELSTRCARLPVPDIDRFIHNNFADVYHHYQQGLHVRHHVVSLKELSKTVASVLGSLKAPHLDPSEVTRKLAWVVGAGLQEGMEVPHAD